MDRDVAPRRVSTGVPRVKMERQRGARGFSLLELVIASAVLLVGILSVVQLVPASLQSDVYNRYDTMATVVAQHQLDLMLSQPVSVSTFIEQVDGQPQSISLGSATATGSPLVVGCRKTDTVHPMLPVNLDSSVQR
jgi:prepilin-type N-terminal cleavage/methylation domain-containing protein